MDKGNDEKKRPDKGKFKFGGKKSMKKRRKDEGKDRQGRKSEK